MDYKIREAGMDDLLKIKKISEKTFTETFGSENTEEGIKKYLKESLSVETLAKELSNPDSFFLCCGSRQ